MRGAVAVWALVQVALLAPPALAGPNEGSPKGIDLPLADTVITQPDWDRKPSGEDMARYYPTMAQFADLTGKAILNCTVTAQGLLANCTISGETPSGFGFGDAALQMASLFRMKPMTVNGVPASGATIRIPINFRLPESESIVDPLAGASTPSPKRLALARRVAAAYVPVVNNSSATAQVSAIREYSGQLTPEENTALDAFAAAVAAEAPGEVERMAKVFAGVYSDKELSDIAVFLESPSGRSWLRNQSEVPKSVRDERAQFNRRVYVEVHRIVCQKTQCLGEDRR